MLRQGGAPSTEALSFFTADLTQDAGWRDAVDGCDYVLHVASPLSSYVPDDENELIIPAREGTLRVLRAARDAAVKRVVITSSMGAIAYGHPPQSAPFDETNWTNLDGARCAALRQVQDARRARRLGFYRQRRRRPRAFGHQPRRACSVPRLGPDFSGSIGHHQGAARWQPCRRCRKSISAWSTCATSPICICAR